MADAFLPAAAPIAAVTGDPKPEAETAGTVRPERSGGWQPGGYFAWRCKAAREGGGGK
jgi:hypothetical protein